MGGVRRKWRVGVGGNEGWEWEEVKGESGRKCLRRK